MMEAPRKCSFDMSAIFLAACIFDRYRRERSRQLPITVYLYRIMQPHFHLTQVRIFRVGSSVKAKKQRCIAFEIRCNSLQFSFDDAGSRNYVHVVIDNPHVAKTITSEHPKHIAASESSVDFCVSS